ncbi:MULTISPECIES: ArdC-like ssDNA-binding domain-containing protein [Aerococcus]|uniref:ArdC-like ssDNA-binding domain-containing protein n=1 Tax=Aerococcus TaxID=1375 RepID=UPI0018A7C167|nr:MULTISPECIES: ArdC-like ssDNA-binding domain-containing protein [Aerococcus]MCY3067601.1 ArdC-like ssDNA-binding domain-containing protein [Aerococcus mictus]MCY3080864.1 ArdC-like ssDNA-binding domain-containing protein [Aerococcus mictus]MDK8485469.1 ArdC-like ssDNA-binding domain-containing protein [Aerococcus urinae]
MKNNEAAKQDRQKKLDEVFSKVHDAVENYSSDPKDLADFIRFRKEFSQNYSTRNQMLIYQQYPTASKVQSYKKWVEEGFQVQKGQKGIRILAPAVKKEIFDGKTSLGGYKDLSNENKVRFKKGELQTKDKLVGFRPVSIFDIQQTNAEVDQLPKYLQDGVINGSQKNENEIYEAIDRYRESLGIEKLEERPNKINAGVRGCYLKSKHDSGEEKRAIWIENNNNISEKIHVYLHELGHAQFDKQSPSQTRVQNEYQAEMFAGVVSEYFGIESSQANAKYLEGYLQNEPDMANREKLLEPLIQSIDKAVPQIENQLSNIVRDQTRDIDNQLDNYWKIKWNESSQRYNKNYEGQVVNKETLDELVELDTQLQLHNKILGFVDPVNERDMTTQYEGYHKFMFEHIKNEESIEEVRVDMGDGRLVNEGMFKSLYEAIGEKYQPLSQEKIESIIDELETERKENPPLSWDDAQALAQDEIEL